MFTPWSNCSRSNGWISMIFFFSCYHVGVCVIFKKVAQINKRFLLTLEGFWPTISLFFKRSPFVSLVFPIPTTIWMILQPFVFANVYFKIKLENVFVLLRLFNPWLQPFFWRASLQLCAITPPSIRLVASFLFLMFDY